MLNEVPAGQALALSNVEPESFSWCTFSTAFFKTNLRFIAD